MNVIENNSELRVGLIEIVTVINYCLEIWITNNQSGGTNKRRQQQQQHRSCLSWKSLSYRVLYIRK